MAKMGGTRDFRGEVIRDVDLKARKDAIVIRSKARRWIEIEKTKSDIVK